MLRDLAKDDGYVTFKRAAVDRGGWTLDIHSKYVRNLLYSGKVQY